MVALRRVLSVALVQLVIEVGVVVALVSPYDLLYRGVSLLPSYPARTHDVFAQALTTALLFGVLLLAGRVLEHCSPADMGLRGQHAGRDLALGAVVGAGLIGVVVGVLALAGWYRVVGVAPLSALPALVPWLVLFLLAAAFEEGLFRGIIFRLLERGLGSWIAVALSALVLGVSHLGTPHATVAATRAIALTAGVAGGAAYMLTRSLWPVIGAHFGWNFCEGPLFGTQVSGSVTPVVLHSTMRGPPLWTGGAFGPEAGLVTVIVALVVGVVLLALAVQRGHVISPPWMQPPRRTLRPHAPVVA